ncbi:MAG TPA: peptide deformylase [Gammaproteobacteria bacterium]|nr:peptide deformylase [Gammaproteobacteria bacterium]
MSLMNILQFPDPRLKKVAVPVDTFDQELWTLIDSMFETMYEAYGCGLAAIQVNVQKQVIVIDVSEKYTHPLCLVNPEILSTEETTSSDEGCLSFPGVHAKGVKRAKNIKVRFYDRLGKIQELATSGLLAICIQHEIDHLKGVTFYDHLSPLKQDMLMKALIKIRRRAL